MLAAANVREVPAEVSGAEMDGEDHDDDQLLSEATSVGSAASMMRTPRGKRGGRTGNQRQASERRPHQQQLY